VPVSPRELKNPYLAQKSKGFARSLYLVGGGFVTNRSHLQAVGPDTPAPKQTPKSITEALAGSSRDVLAAMRQALAKKLDDGEVSSNAIASAYKELRELDRLIRLADEEDGEGEVPDAGSARRRTFDATAL
ncbi:MAG TPA: hypothetical protein VK053_21200, partial [Jiangellaceae bacterium]|nr:hypothetical protein [Jiangellaceae bacterium]